MQWIDEYEQDRQLESQSSTEIEEEYIPTCYELDRFAVNSSS